MLQTRHFDRFEGSDEASDRFWLPRVLSVLFSVSSRMASSEAGEWGLGVSEGVLGCVVGCMVGCMVG